MRNEKRRERDSRLDERRRCRYYIILEKKNVEKQGEDKHGKSTKVAPGEGASSREGTKLILFYGGSLLKKEVRHKGFSER